MADDLEPDDGLEELDETEIEVEGDGPEDDTETDGDADSGDDNPDDDGDGAAGGDEPDGTSARQGRGKPDSRQRDARRSREARLEREIEELKRRSPAAQVVDTAAQARQYQENEGRLLTAARERENQGEIGAVAQYFFERNQRETNAQLGFQQNQSFEREDSRDFRALCRDVPSFGKIKDWVEDAVAKARSNGNYQITREALAKFRLGELLIQRGGEKLARGNQRAAGQRQRQVVRAPSGAGGDVAPRGGRRKPESEWTPEDYERYAGNVALTDRGTRAR